MANTPDGKYARRAWDKVTAPVEAAYPPQAYIGPFASNQERLLTQSMAVGSMTPEEVQAYVRPNLPQIKLFPARYGYETAEYGIQDIIEINGRQQQRVDPTFGQQPNATESTSRNTLGQV